MSVTRRFELPDEILQEIWKDLSPAELARATRVSKSWKNAIENFDWAFQARRYKVPVPEKLRCRVREIFASPPSDVFGPEKWEQFLGVIPCESAGLAPDIHENWVRLRDTHILVFLPRTVIKMVEGQTTVIPVTLKTIHELIIAVEGVGHRVIDSKILEHYGDVPLSNARWVLLMKTPLQETKGKGYIEQKNLLAQRGYRIPRILEVVIPILLHRLSSRESLLSIDPARPRRRIHTQCEEAVDGFQVIVGPFQDRGLWVTNYYVGEKSAGSMGVKSFPNDADIRAISILL